MGFIFVWLLKIYLNERKKSCKDRTLLMSFSLIICTGKAFKDEAEIVPSVRILSRRQVAI